LRAAAALGGTHMRIPSGAVGGLDALAAARLGGLTSVTYVGRKPVAAWQGTKAEESVVLADISAATAVFEGTAREAALAYPQNANVAAAIALAGVGFDATRVTLIADPAARGNEHHIEAEGAFGRLTPLRSPANRYQEIPRHPVSPRTACCVAWCRPLTPCRSSKR
jgi:aspartate dehydrogenase